jgi:hypothetical protein
MQHIEEEGCPFWDFRPAFCRRIGQIIIYKLFGSIPTSGPCLEGGGFSRLVCH